MLQRYSGTHMSIVHLDRAGDLSQRLVLACNAVREYGGAW